MLPEGIDINAINQMSAQSMVGHLGIEFIECTTDHLTAKMPVNEKTIQPFGLLHGGASVALAETLGSVASNLLLEKGQMAVGLEINANHLRPAREGFVIGKATPIHVGRKTHVWSIEISDQNDKMICVSRLTIAIIDKK
ncbi:MAG: hotdog fold thioesterase [Cyclobacteriaceae bacterium]